MGILVSVSNIGRDTFDVMQALLKRLKGGLAISTVGANAVFAAITGISIASASVFTRVAVPEMIRHGYDKRLAVGVVAGSSVLGMLNSAKSVIHSFWRNCTGVCRPFIYSWYWPRFITNSSFYINNCCDCSIETGYSTG